MSHGGVASSRASHSSRQRVAAEAGVGRHRVHRDLADRVLAQLAGRHAAADVVDVGQVAVVGALDGHDRAEVRRPQLRDLDRGERAVADAPHPDRAVAPRLGGEPLDGVVAVERLGLGVLVERDARRTSRCRGRRPGTKAIAAGGELRRRARCPRCAASCPCRTGSSRGSPGTAGPRRRRPAPAATGSPTARCRRGPGSGRPSSRSRPRGGWLAGRADSASVGRTSPRVYGPTSPVGDADARRVRRCGHGRPAGPHRPVDARLAPGRLRERVDHDLARRGRPGPTAQPGIYGVVHFANLAAGVVALDDEDRVLLVGQHRYTLDAYSWEIPEGGVPEGEIRSTAPGASSARRPGSTPPTGASSPASTSPTPSRTRSRSSISRRGFGTARRRRTAPKQLEVRWLPFDDVLAMTLDGRITDAMTVLAIERVALARLAATAVAAAEAAAEASGQ